MQRSHAHHLFFIRRFNDEKAAHQLLGFGIRPVGRGRLAAAPDASNYGRGRGAWIPDQVRDDIRGQDDMQRPG